MSDPISGPLAAPRLGTATDNARQSTDTGLARQGTEGGSPQQPAPPAPTVSSSGLAAPAVRLAAELLRLDPGLVLEALMGGPDEAGRPTIVTNAGLFAVTGENPSLPPPGAPLSVEVIRSGELLSVLLRGASARGAVRAFDLQYLGSAPPPEGGEPTAPRSLFQAVQVMAEGGRQFSLAVHLGGARVSENALPVTVTARQPQPDGTITLTLRAADGSRVTIADAPPAIATGTRLLLEVVSRQPVAAGTRPAVVQTSQPTLAGAPPVIQEFAAGRDAVSALAPLLAAAGDDVPALARVLPGLAQEEGQALPVALLGAALKFKDFRRLIGPEREARVLARGGPGPLLRAGAAFTEFARAAKEDAPSGWRAVPLPFFDGR
ncbi:MAG: hypothetical protein PHS60_02705, partial [Zavarzinia sp.]|nr:hypothetical protein [Zavarzinia sp.]